jgi:hypothetical protein
MRISVECDVVGKIQIGKEIKLVSDSKEYILKPDNSGWLKTIVIIKAAKRPDKYSRRVERGFDSVGSTIRINSDIEEHFELQREFQELESLLSFETHGSLKSIAWDSPMEVWIPETYEEQERIRISGLKMTKEPPDLTKRLSLEQFSQIIKTKNYYTSLIIPKAFFKECLNEFYSKRYINAFYNSYFILEDIYGKGKTRNREIADAFKRSKVFNEILQRMITKISENNYEKNIRKLCSEEEVEFNAEGLINLIWKVRGNLHHYSSKSSKHLGTPFSHENFESIAFLTLGLAYHTILKKTEEINKSLGISI